MKKVIVALITPFRKDYSIDYDGLKIIIDDLIKEGCEGFVISGTTGEASTLSEKEKFTLLDFVVSYCNKKVEIYFGCGSNNTEETIRLCKKAQNYPINGLLLVTPYYNKPTQEGLYQHFSCISKNCNLPIILYQVENRCACKFTIQTLKRLVNDCSNIKAIKLASNDLDLAKSITSDLPVLKLYCGVDDRIKEYKDMGAYGIISVIGHIAVKELIDFYVHGNISVDDYFKKLSSYVFLESNPIGIKYILSKKYPIQNILRLPLTSLSEENKKKIDLFFNK